MSFKSKAQASPNSAAAVTTSGQCENSRAISSPERRCAPPTGSNQPATSSRLLRARTAAIAMARRLR
ncbi:Uncharacterised protein [Mycobacteroides abscessus subsp. abscessus]|nr:Uncharacterised protein [Mycobacteroides abscessus subsp. abscessus]